MKYYYNIYNSHNKFDPYQRFLKCNPKLADEKGTVFAAFCVLDADLSDLPDDSLFATPEGRSEAWRIFKGTVPSDMAQAWLQTERTLVFLISVTKSAAQFSENAFYSRMIKYGESFITALEMEHNMTCAVSISPHFSELKSCDDAIRDALIMAEFARFMDYPAQVIEPSYYEALKVFVGRMNPDYHMENYERPLLSAVLKHNFIHAELIATNYFVAHLLDPIFVFPTVLANVDSIVRLCMAMTGIDPRKMSFSEGRFDDLRAKIQICPTYNLMKEYLHEFFEILGEYVRREPEISATNRKLQKIIDYINENYSDPLLSAATLCDKYDISISYLSRAFKEHMGVNLSVFIQTLRIAKAKQLLLETDLTIDKIASVVGYSGGQNLLRLFNKFERVSPTVYKSLSKIKTDTTDQEEQKLSVQSKK